MSKKPVFVSWACLVCTLSIYFCSTGVNREDDNLESYWIKGHVYWFWHNRAYLLSNSKSIFDLLQGTKQWPFYGPLSQSTAWRKDRKHTGAKVKLGVAISAVSQFCLAVFKTNILAQSVKNKAQGVTDGPKTAIWPNMDFNCIFISFAASPADKELHHTHSYNNKVNT